MIETCPHGDLTCPCPENVVLCRYEGAEAEICPNPPLGFLGLTWAHCHNEGCTWHVSHEYEPGNGWAVTGECGLVALGLPPLEVGGVSMYSMTQAKPGLPGWPCGWLRTPLNVANTDRPSSDS